MGAEESDQSQLAFWQQGAAGAVGDPLKPPAKLFKETGPAPPGSPDFPVTI